MISFALGKTCFFVNHYCVVLITEVTICMKLQGENAVNFIEAAF